MILLSLLIGIGLLVSIFLIAYAAYKLGRLVERSKH